jgi:RimJ/RimL family protein N-acetyltransferase
MYVTRHTDPDAFLEAAAPMTARGAASASLFTGWAHALKRRPPSGSDRPYLATWGGAGAAMRRDGGPAIVGQSDPEAAAAFAEDLAGDCPQLEGVVGSVAACEAFARRWRELTGRTRSLRVRLRHHALEAAAEAPSVPGAARASVEADLAWLGDAQVAFMREVGLVDSVERMRATLPGRVAREEFRVWDDGEPVAYAGFNDAAPDFARIAPVYTFPHRRGRGYATALVAALARELLAAGKQRLFLTTDVANPTSNAIYARIGFVAENDECHFDFVDASAGADP